MDLPPTKQQRNSQVMELKQLIATPLVATLEADAMATSRYVDFLKEVAFEPDESGGLGRLRTFVFQYYQNEQGSRLLKTVEIPVISLIPIPLLQIKEAVFDFDIKILDAVSQYSEQEFSFDQPPQDADRTESRFFLRAALAPQQGQSTDKREQSLTANMKVHVVMHQADVPAGLSNLLALSAHNMSVENAIDRQKLPSNI